MSLQLLKTGLWFAMVGCLMGNSVGADVYSVTYTGTITGVTANLSSGFSPGQTLSGTLLFESSTPPISGGTVNGAVFDAILSHSLAFSGGSTSYSAALPFGLTGKPEIQVDNAGGGFPNDRFAMLSRASEGLVGPDVGGLALHSIGIRFDDSTNAVFSNALVLPTNLTLANFDSSSFFLFFGSGLEGLVNGNMTSLSFAPVTVPEPGMAGLMLVLVAGLTLGRSRVLAI